MDISNIIKNKWFVISTASIVSIGGAVGIVYIYKKRSKTTAFDMPTQLSIFDIEVEDISEPITKQTDEPDNKPVQYNKPISDDLAKAREEKLRQFKSAPRKIEPIPDEEPSAPVNIFKRERADVWDHEAELAARTSTMPYIIHQDEYISDEMEFNQQTVTYYAGDDIMADQDDTPIYNYASIMGELKFGHGSNDKNVVYIRNEKFRTEWEVLYHPGSFSHEILGHRFQEESEQELRHSVQKFRPE